MKRLNSNLFLIILVVLSAGTVLTTSCKRGNSLGAVGQPDPDGFESFDTFNFPTADYFFYGKFDGGYKLWQAGERSKWDTITRDTTDWVDGLPYSSLGKYTENIYRNFPEELEKDTCATSDQIWFEQVTRFIRPEIPEERIEIYFYDCIEDFDYIPATPDRNGPVYTNLNWLDYGVAVPFTNDSYGRTGVRLVYIDAERNKWETRAGSGQLLDTYMRITDFYPRIVDQDTLDTLGMYIIEGEFAGRLFNGSDVLPVTQSKFRARLVPQTDWIP